ncbi:MAG: SDR family NAD(P)-dependent oxidoreductase, partial [Polyangiales bacterium]
MTAIEGKVVAVTGAGSGIGRALAQVAVARGAHVALSDVNESGLAETAAALSGAVTKVSTSVVDVRNREAVEGWARSVRDDHGGADVIINNAGLTVRGSIEEL